MPNFRTLFIGTYPPIECGIATFTNDLVTAYDKAGFSSLSSDIMTIVEEDDENLVFPMSVVYKIKKHNNDSYLKAAKFIIDKKYDVVCIQHEFGIFGGEHGKFLLDLLGNINIPVITTLHTVLFDPPAEIINVTRELFNKSQRVIVMAHSAIDILNRYYGIFEQNKISVIPHGVPEFKFEYQDKAKEKIKMTDMNVISTFGLINSGKGLEYMIEAMPKIIEKFPNTVYLIVGETHPKVVKREGEVYRNELVKRISNLNIEDNVVFHKKYLELRELAHYLHATDIYVTPYKSLNQITSGTLAYAMACGKAIVSTPYVYAQELLDEGRGILSQLNDSNSLADNIIQILTNSNLKSSLERNAYQYTRSFLWSEVGHRYYFLARKMAKKSQRSEIYWLNNVSGEESEDEITNRIKDLISDEKIKVNLDHILNLTDDVGIFQHAFYGIPNRFHGYTTDDNARALILLSRLSYKEFHKYEKQFLTYLSFLHYAQADEGLFKNFMSYKRTWLEKVGSEDSFGRSMWALGEAMRSYAPPAVKEGIKVMFKKAIRNILTMKSPRTLAFSLMGCNFYLKATGDESIKSHIMFLAEELVNLYEKNKTDEWHWFENYFTYANARLPQALFIAYNVLGKTRYLEIAKESMDFLCSIVIKEDKLQLIGNEEWFFKGGKPSLFDQQPIDANGMVESLTDAYCITKDEKYYRWLEISLSWFFGRNIFNTALVDIEQGASYDGLTKEGPNLNQGAESTLAYLLSVLYYRSIKQPSQLELPLFRGKKIQLQGS